MPSRHQCPPWCHKCPEMGGDVYPVCWGSVHRNDLKGCHCERPRRDVQNDDGTEVTWDQLVARLVAIEQALGVDGGHVKSSEAGQPGKP